MKKITREGKTQFIFKLVDENEPLKKDKSFKFFINHPKLKTNKSYCLIAEYLDSIGMNNESEFIKSHQYDTLKIILDVAYRCWLPSAKTYKFNELFNDTKHSMKVKLKEFITEQGYIYGDDYEKLYFEIITPNGSKSSFLHYKYQQIIGGRKLCKIDLESFKNSGIYQR